MEEKNVWPILRHTNFVNFSNFGFSLFNANGTTTLICNYLPFVNVFGDKNHFHFEILILIFKLTLLRNDLIKYLEAKTN